MVYRKALNLVEIFEGGYPVVWFDSTDRTYHASSRGLALTDFVLEQLIALLGKENVILK